MRAAVDNPCRFNAVADNPTAAVVTLRREQMNGAFKAVESMFVAAEDNIEGILVLVSASRALTHGKPSRILCWKTRITL